MADIATDHTAESSRKRQRKRPSPRPASQYDLRKEAFVCYETEMQRFWYYVGVTDLAKDCIVQQPGKSEHVLYWAAERVCEGIKKIKKFCNMANTQTDCYNLLKTKRFTIKVGSTEQKLTGTELLRNAAQFLIDYTVMEATKLKDELERDAHNREKKPKISIDNLFACILMGSAVAIARLTYAKECIERSSDVGSYTTLTKVPFNQSTEKEYAIQQMIKFGVSQPYIEEFIDNWMTPKSK